MIERFAPAGEEGESTVGIRESHTFFRDQGSTTRPPARPTYRHITRARARAEAGRVGLAQRVPCHFMNQGSTPPSGAGKSSLGSRG